MRKFIVAVNGTTYEVDVEEITGGSIPKVESAPAAAPAPAPAPKAAPAAPVAAAAPAGATTISSPMPGTILGVNVKPGDAVEKGTVLMLLEAMKMENEIMAPATGKVISVNVQKGASVNAGDVLAVID